MPPAACTCSACVNEHAVSLPLIFFVSGPLDQSFKTMNSFKRRVKCLCVLGKLPFDVVPATGRVTLYAFHYAPTRRRTTHGNSPKRLRLLTSPLRYWLSKWSHSARSHTRRPVRDALEEYLRPNVTQIHCRKATSTHAGPMPFLVVPKSLPDAPDLRSSSLSLSTTYITLDV